MQHCKVHPRLGHESPWEEQMYSPTLSLTLIRDEVGSRCHAPAALPPRKNRYPLYRRLGGSQGQSEQVQKILSPPEFDPWTIQPKASHYTNYTIPDHICHTGILQTSLRSVQGDAEKPECSEINITGIQLL